MKKSIYQLLIDTACCGGYWKIDLKKGDLKIGKKIYVEDGINCSQLRLINYEEIEFKKTIYETLDMLYENYKESYPNHKFKRKEWFKKKEISKEEEIKYLKNENQELAQAKLEGLVLLTNQLEVGDDRWFYQGKDKDFVILKDWIR